MPTISGLTYQCLISKYTSESQGTNACVSQFMFRSMMKGNPLEAPITPPDNETKPSGGISPLGARNMNQLTDFDSFSLELSHDREKGEVRILDQRFAVIDIAAFCQRWDALVGRKVAGVQMKSLEYHLGEEDAQAIMKKTPNATAEQVIVHLQEADRISGVGVTKVSRMSRELIHIEIQNPVVAAAEGAAAFFASGWWCGALDTVLKGRFDVRDTIHDKEKNVLRFNLTARPGQEKD
jgi:hypothetical protein